MAGKQARKADTIAGFGDKHYVLAGDLQSRLKRLGKARAVARRDGQPIHYHLDLMPAATVYGVTVGQSVELPIQPYPPPSVALSPLKQELIRLTGPRMQRCTDQYSLAGQVGQRTVCHLIYRLGTHCSITGRAVRLAQASHQHPQVIVDLGYCAHRRARCVAAVDMVQADSRRQAGDAIHLRLFHLLDELTGIG